jgi:hypothetical protein
LNSDGSRFDQSVQATKHVAPLGEAVPSSIENPPRTNHWSTPGIFVEGSFWSFWKTRLSRSTRSRVRSSDAPSGSWMAIMM